MGVVSKDEIKALMAECYLSTKTTAKVLFPESFSRPFASVTEPVFALLDDDQYSKVVIKAPRGWGKSTLLNVGYAGKKTLFREKHFIVPISSTATKAQMESENLKLELMTNQEVKKIFGNVKTNKVDDSGIDPTFSKEMWVANGETLIFPRGAGQQVRGVRWGKRRPDLIIVDDLEDPEQVESEEQRKKLKQWFFADVMNSIDRSVPHKIIFIGTLLHENSLLADLLADPSWKSVEIDLCNDALESNWPDFMTTDEVKELYESYRRQGLLDVFYREYRGIPIAKETATFKQEFFRYYNETDDKFIEDRRKLETIVIIDPAKTTNVASDFSAIVGVGINTEATKIYIRDIDADRMHPDEIYRRAFDMADRLGARTIGYEVTSLNEFITYPITTYMIQRGKFYNLVELKARGKKEDRIAMLSPLYRLGYIYHNKAVSATLESQLLSFPKSKRDDVMDATAYLVEMLEIGERYFQPDDVEFEDKAEDIEAEFADMDEPAMKGWRISP
ncbi:MAG: hypothetical protein WC455_22460 [Dehalococcoidia bacterium]